MTRKVFRSGNSLVVTLPPEVRELGISEDTGVEVEIRDGKIVIEAASNLGLTTDFLEWTDAFIERHRTLLERLA